MRNRLIVPIFSMRSYKTGNYSVLKDGNFQLHLHRARKGDFIAIPDKVDDLDDLIKLFPEFDFIKLKYGANALQSRERFWDVNQVKVDNIMDDLALDILITDITDYTGTHKVIFNFNITKDPEVERLYIDKFINRDVRSVNRSLCTFVLNDVQKRVLVSSGAHPDKIIVTQKTVNPYVLERFCVDSNPIVEFTDKTVFFPFRISDKCYDFPRVVDNCKRLGYTLIVTDPNDTLIDSVHADEPFIVKVKPTKEQYYTLLASVPTIMYNENPEKVYHPGLGELIYFGAKIISDYNIPTYESVVIDYGENVWRN